MVVRSSYSLKVELKVYSQGKGYDSEVEHLPSVWEALGSISSTEREKQQKQTKNSTTTINNNPKVTKLCFTLLGRSKKEEMPPVRTPSLEGPQ